MKRYDTHRNFPPARRPRDSTPAPPEDDELEQLLTTSSPVPAETLVVMPEGSGEASPASEHTEPSPLPSSVESALTAYVESLPASDPEPRVEEREIDIDAEAARRAGSAAAVTVVEAAPEVASAPSSASAGEVPVAPVIDYEPVAAEASASSRALDSDERDDENDEPEREEDAPASLAPSDSRRSVRTLDSIAATARSTAPVVARKRGTSPAVWIAGFTLAGIALALWSMSKLPEIQEKAAVHAASPSPLDAPVVLDPPTESAPAPEATPVPSASAALLPADSAVPAYAAPASVR